MWVFERTLNRLTKRKRNRFENGSQEVFITSYIGKRTMSSIIPFFSNILLESFYFILFYFYF